MLTKNQQQSRGLYHCHSAEFYFINLFSSAVSLLKCFLKCLFLFIYLFIFLVQVPISQETAGEFRVPWSVVHKNIKVPRRRSH